MNNIPDIDDMSMSEEINRMLQEDPQADVGEIVRQKVARDAAEEAEVRTFQEAPGIVPGLSMDYVLSRMDAILNDTAHIHEAIQAVGSIPVMTPADGMVNYQGDYAGQAKAAAIAETVKAREATNRQLLGLLERMYDDLKPTRVVPEDMPRWLMKSIDTLPPGEKIGVLSTLMKRRL